MRGLRVPLLAACAVVLSTGCGVADVGSNAPQTLQLTSSSFSGGTIPKRHTCDGAGASPELSWGSGPAGTRSFALIVTDRDSLLGLGAVFGYFVHWLVYDIPADSRELAAGISAEQRELPNGSRQGTSDFDRIGYGAPCPPGHSPHHYAFQLYALDTKMSLPAGASAKSLLQAMRGHVLAKGELVSSFAR